MRYRYKRIKEGKHPKTKIINHERYQLKHTASNKVDIEVNYLDKYKKGYKTSIQHKKGKGFGYGATPAWALYAKKKK